jgi:hypothetical protein
LRALNILREAAGLQPLAAQGLTTGEMSFASNDQNLWMTLGEAA